MIDFNEIMELYKQRNELMEKKIAILEKKIKQQEIKILLQDTIIMLLKCPNEKDSDGCCSDSDCY